MDTERRLVALPDGREIDLLLPGEGHLTIGVSGIGRILDDVLDLGGVSLGNAPTRRSGQSAAPT
jgi:hypothetical protein